MGGCRCTFRNCKSKSDGRKTHLFHYPVFDKLRCQQWIVNARRFEFLNLTVGQLKNRVVCQHHFQNDNFMNFKKNSLKFDAVPTLNGPFCTKEEETKLYAEAVSDLPLNADDIENIETMCTSEKKGQMPVKYVHFLTDGVQTDIDSYTSKKNLLTDGVQRDIDSFTSKKKDYISIDIDLNKTYENDLDTDIKIKDCNVKSLQENVVGTTTTINDMVKKPTEIKKEAFNCNKKVSILSQQVLSEPLKMELSGNLVDIITSNNIKKNADTLITKTQYFKNNTNNVHVQFIETTTKDEKRKPELIIENNMASQKPQKIKHLTPEKIEAIQEKRNFNLKLRDIITAGLNKINDDSNNTSLKSEDKKCETRETQLGDKDNLTNDLKKQMQVMESNLIKKMEQNSNQILTIKKILNLTNNNQHNKSILRKKKSTQTACSDEEHKIYLFNELSVFVSEDLKNQLYQELFIDNDQNNSVKKPKRRKC